MERICNNLQETKEFAEEIANSIFPPFVITLNGDLGAGKTAFTKFFAKAIGINSVVTSPTFTLMNEYDEGKYPLYHFDMYRIEDSSEIEELGLNDYINTKKGVVIVEWPQAIQSILPKIGYDIEIIKLDETSRKFIVKSRS